MRKLVLAAVVVASLCAVPGAASARTAAPAAFPGQNGKIVFDSYPNSSTPYEEIYTVNPNGSGLTRMTNNNGNQISDVSPDWAPSGNKFVFVRVPANGDSEIYVMNQSGTIIDRITNDSAYEYWPAWSPDGTKIAYEKGGVGSGSEIWVKDLSSGTATRMTTPPTGADDLSPEWKPDGSQIAFTRLMGDRDEIDTVDVVAAPFGPGAEHQVVSAANAYNDYPDWSPSGNAIAFARWTSALGQGEIFITYVSGTRAGTTDRITRSNNFYDTMPAFSPSGGKLVWARGDPNGQTPDDLVIRDIGTGQQQLLTSGSGQKDQRPDWGPA